MMMMKKYIKYAGALLLAIIAVGMAAWGSVAVSSKIDFVEGQKIPATLYGDHVILGATRSITHVNTSATVDNAVDTYHLNSSAGAILMTMPSGATCAGKEWIFFLGTAGNAVTFTPSAVGDLINGAQSAYAPGMDAVGDSTRIVCSDDGDFYSIGGKIH
jgi:hypothetical protein